MAKYKAKSSYKDLDTNYFGIHNHNSLVRGGSIEITDFDSLPESVRECLEEDKPIVKTTIKKKAKKVKGVNNGTSN